MSTSAPAEQPVMLNAQQVDAIINFARNNGMYEGEPPSDPEARLKDASTLVYHARRARDNGNQTDKVREICFIADVDQSPPVAQPVAQPGALADPAAAFAPPAQSQAQQAAPAPAPAAPAAPAPPPPADNGFDLSQQPDATLAAILSGLEPNKDNPAVAAEIQRIQAEQQRRASGAPAPTQAQVTPPAPQGAPAATPPASPAPSQPVPDQGATPAVAGPLPPGAFDATGQPRQPADDASAPPAVQAPQPGSQGAVPPAQAPTEAERRAELERQISGAMLVAYGKTFADVQTMPLEDLARMVANPGGPVNETTVTAPPAAPLSTEREALEGQITGPMLKAYGRGRLDIPHIGDNELRLMIQYPDGGVPQEQLVAVRAADGTVAPQAPPTPSAPPVVAPSPVPSPPPVPVPQPVAAAPVPSVITPPAHPEVNVSRRETAEQIIAAERLPVPPEVEQPPALPFDISKTSDEELRSVHGRFHAVETRCNWILASRQDEIDDLERLKAGREAEVRNMPREGKKPTKDEMAAIVAADPQVVQLIANISEIEKANNKIKVIRDNAHLTCQRCSREYSMRYREEDDTPRRGG